MFLFRAKEGTFPHNSSCTTLPKIHQAVLNNDYQILYSEAQQGKVNTFCGCGFTPLAVACIMLNTSVVETLLNTYFANVNQPNSQNNNTLHLLFHHLMPPQRTLSKKEKKALRTIVTALLQCEADGDALNEHTESPLSLSLKLGDPDVVGLLAAKSKKEKREFKGTTAFHQALGRLDLLKALKPIAADDVNKPNSMGLPCFFYAQTEDELNLLITLGADIGYKTKQGRNALFYCPAEMVETLVKTGKFAINAPDNSGKTALMCSTKLSKVQQLIANGANVNAQDDEGNTLLHNSDLYTDNNLQELFDYLLTLPSLTFEPNRQGRRPLDIACQFGGVSHVLPLIERYKQSILWENYKTTILEYCIIYRQNFSSEVIRLLLENGAEITQNFLCHCMDKYNYRLNEDTARELVSLLVQYSKSELDWTGLFSYALRNNHIAVTTLLLSQGVDVGRVFLNQSQKETLRPLLRTYGYPEESSPKSHYKRNVLAAYGIPISLRQIFDRLDADKTPLNERIFAQVQSELRQEPAAIKLLEALKELQKTNDFPYILLNRVWTGGLTDAESLQHRHQKIVSALKYTAQQVTPDAPEFLRTIIVNLLLAVTGERDELTLKDYDWSESTEQNVRMLLPILLWSIYRDITTPQDEYDYLENWNENLSRLSELFSTLQKQNSYESLTIPFPLRKIIGKIKEMLKMQPWMLKPHKGIQYLTLWGVDEQLQAYAAVDYFIYLQGISQQFDLLEYISLNRLVPPKGYFYLNGPHSCSTTEIMEVLQETPFGKWLVESGMLNQVIDQHRESINAGQKNFYYPGNPFSDDTNGDMEYLPERADDRSIFYRA